MLARQKSVLRFVLLLGLLLIEASLVIAFYVIPQFQPLVVNAHPDIGLEIDAVLQQHPGLKVAIIAYLAIFSFGNIGLIVLVWRAFKSLRIETRKR